MTLSTHFTGRKIKMLIKKMHKWKLTRALKAIKREQEVSEFG